MAIGNADDWWQAFLHNIDTERQSANRNNKPTRQAAQIKSITGQPSAFEPRIPLIGRLNGQSFGGKKSQKEESRWWGIQIQTKNSNKYEKKSKQKLFLCQDN